MNEWEVIWVSAVIITEHLDCRCFVEKFRCLDLCSADELNWCSLFSFQSGLACHLITTRSHYNDVLQKRSVSQLCLKGINYKITKKDLKKKTNVRNLKQIREFLHAVRRIVCLFVCLSVRPFVHIHPSIHPSIHFCIYLSADCYFHSLCLSVYQLDVVTTFRGGAIWWMRTKAKGRHGVVCRLNCVIHVWAPGGRDTCHLGHYINPRTFTFTFTCLSVPTSINNNSSVF